MNDPLGQNADLKSKSCYWSWIGGSLEWHFGLYQCGRKQAYSFGTISNVGSDQGRGLIKDLVLGLIQCVKYTYEKIEPAWNSKSRISLGCLFSWWFSWVALWLALVRKEAGLAIWSNFPIDFPSIVGGDSRAWRLTKSAKRILDPALNGWGSTFDLSSYAWMNACYLTFKAVLSVRKQLT